MNLFHKPDFEETRNRWRAFWAGEIIDRPCVRIVSPRQGAQPHPHPPAVHIHTTDYRSIAEEFDEWASTMWFGGEAVPAFMPNFGPDQFAAFFGSQLAYSSESSDTTWAVPSIENWAAADICFDSPRGQWWDRMLEFLSAIADVGRFRFLAAVPDIHSNLDCLAAMRGPQRLCEDLIDAPEAVDRAMRNVRRAFPTVYDAIYAAGEMEASGTTSWLPYYCDGRFSVLQCDFICMISPSHFRRWALPALEEEAAFLDHSVYHLDGPDALVHLDDILSIKAVDGIQWVPGEGNPPPIEWPDLLRRIQSAGKGLYLGASPEQVKVFHRMLRPERVFYDVWGASQSEGEELLTWLVANT